MDLRIERWHGQYGHGAMRDRKRMKREQAEARNALTKPEDRRQARLAAQKADAVKQANRTASRKQRKRDKRKGNKRKGKTF